MEVVVGKLAGFCPGVESTINRAKKLLEEKDKIYCLGEIVHNNQVIESLENKGMITVDNIEDVPDNSILIFRAHGEPEYKYEIAKQKGLELHDLTCGNVIAIHKKVQKEKEDAFIIILGKKKHPEVLGTKGFAGENYYVVESEDDILDAYMEYEKNMIGQVKIFAQTTFKLSKFDELVEELTDNFAEAEVKVFNTICLATSSRQAEMIKMAEELDNMIIIGGKNSANTKKLVDISKENCKNVYHVQTVDDLKVIDFSGVEKIGIMAGASTPKTSIENIRIYLENL